jgi:hypothetical protein
VAAQKVGPGAAEFLGKAHERFSNAESFFNMFGVGEPRYDYDMDVQNNRIGIGLADQATSREELEALVKQMASARLLVETLTYHGPWIRSSAMR